jgi:general secretion pathway protein G
MLRRVSVAVPRRSSRGFTLIELLAVLAVLAVLATIAIPVAEVTVQRQKEADLRIALREVRSAIDAYKKAYDEGRIARTINSNGYPVTLAALVDGIEDARDPKKSRMYFLRRIPQDPMAASAASDPMESWGKRSYASGPEEPKEGSDVFDIYSRSTRIGLNGVPYTRW